MAKNVQLFWHVAIMGNWREIVTEQTALFRQARLRPMIGRVGKSIGGELTRIGKLVYASPRLKYYELPTLRKLWEYCQLNPKSIVIYCHTKGANHSVPEARAWRKLMEWYVVTKWRENLPLLEDHDAVGVNWRDWHILWNRLFTNSNFFDGNFWMATADWINKLPAPFCPDRPRNAQCRRRGWAERWLGSRSGIRVVSLGSRNAAIRDLSVSIPMLRACGHPEYISSPQSFSS